MRDDHGDELEDCGWRISCERWAAACGLLSRGWCPAPASGEYHLRPAALLRHGGGPWARLSGDQEGGGGGGEVKVERTPQVSESGLAARHRQSRSDIGGCWADPD